MLVSRLRWLTIMIFVVGIFSFVLAQEAKAETSYFRNVYWMCQDGVSSRQGGSTICKSNDVWYKMAGDACANHCEKISGKCGIAKYTVTTECNLPEVVVPKPTCKDTDGGNEIFTKGTLSVYTPAYGNQTVIEACADDKTMDELVCLTGDATYAYTHKKTECPYGCKAGACIATAPIVNTKADLGLYGFLKIGQSKLEVKWGGTVTLTKADAMSISGNQAAFNLYYTDKNYGDVKSGLYRNEITFNGKLVSQQTNRQLESGVKEDIWTQAYFPIGNGTYILKLLVDADGQVVESSETNNSFFVYVKLSGFEESPVATPTIVNQCDVLCKNNHNVNGVCGSNLSNTTVDTNYCASGEKCYCLVAVAKYDRNAIPKIITPVNDAVLTNYPRQTEIRWMPVTSASKYDVEVACDYCGSSRWSSVNNWSATATYLITPALAGDNQFRVRVRATYPDNTNSQWSDYVYFKYNTSNYTQPTAVQPSTQPSTQQPTTDPAVQPATEPLPTQQIVETKPATSVPQVNKKPTGRMLCGNSAGGDGLYSACINNNVKHDSGLSFKVRTYDSRNVWLTVGKSKTKYIRVPLKKGVEVKRTDGEIILKVSYVKKSPKYGVFLQVETTFDANVVEEEDDVIESNETLSSGGDGSMLPAYDETKPSVAFVVSVNDYPSHKDYAKSKDIVNAYVNMYTVSAVDNGTFKVLSYITENTGAAGKASLSVKSGQMVYFEGYKTEAGAKAGAVKMMVQGQTTPPYKNFSSVKNMLCQTNYSKTDEFLGGTSDYACASNLSTPYQD